MIDTRLATVADLPAYARGLGDYLLATWHARQSGTSHAVFKTPWPGDPRVNIQRAKGGKAKPYQVTQVLKAIDKLSKEEAK